MYTVRPISDWTGFGSGEYRNSPFTVTWSACTELLARELDFLDATNVVLELDVHDGQIKIDGQMRANTIAASPSARLAFDSVRGPLVYATDRFVKAPWRRGGMQQSWQHNVYAIAKALEALRLVDRYEVTKRGEQYLGFKALPGATAMPAAQPMTEAAAAELLRSYGKIGVPLSSCYRAAIKATHPDAGGSREDFDRVMAAARMLGLAS